MKKEKVEKLGRKIYSLEQQYQICPDTNIADEIEGIILSLTFEEILEIDEFIQEKLLTK